MVDVGRLAHAQKFAGRVACVAEKDTMTRVVKMAALEGITNTFVYSQVLNIRNACN